MFQRTITQGNDAFQSYGVILQTYGDPVKKEDLLPEGFYHSFTNEAHNQADQQYGIYQFEEGIELRGEGLTRDPS
jgi:hypothetical protein